jgi:uncharacterized membrane protein YdbT with pleckstrin-like domain
MPYPKKLLNDGEEIAFDLKPHWWFFAKEIMVGVPLFLIGMLILIGLDDDAQKYTGWVWGIGTVVFAIWLGIEYLNWQFTYFVGTSDRVVFRTGVIAKHGVEIPLERINNINFHQRIWERIIGAGDLEIESAGRDGQTRFDNVRHPDGVQQELYRLMEANAKRRASWQAQGAAPAAAAPAAPAAPDVADQLHKLADLRDRGAITEDEYNAKKAELLDRM